ncbi:hypothetical protein P4V39_00930 [Brevibacillus borstelensis]|uniref:hypothetical protein n=1 Tax=Brevibacillus borstelensis TaxID=45462 RepID=UPI002E1F6FB0|nr:hypothetical protein [Brevibacillus borstelensis]
MKKNGNMVVLVTGLLGAAKLALEAFGYSIITDDQINAIANGVAAVAAVVATWMNNHRKDVGQDGSNN